jgi:hypothetical protein
MTDWPIRHFRLSPPGGRGVSCDADGALIGPVPLLQRTTDLSGRESWAPRSATALNADLGFCYGLPVDVASRAGGLIAVARALNGGAILRAKIAALHLQFPDLPPLTRSYEETAALAKALYQSGILKADWDPAKHPRLGGPPNAGWFAPVGLDGNAPEIPQKEPPTEKAKNAVRKTVAQWLLHAALSAANVEPHVRMAVEVSVAAADWLSPYVDAYLDPPKSLEELQEAVNNPQTGYDTHHIVEQSSAKEDGFPRSQIDAPDNLVLIPRLKHWEINAWFATPNPEYDWQSPRDYLRGKNWDERMQVGLDEMIKVGVLKP